MENNWRGRRRQEGGGEAGRCEEDRRGEELLVGIVVLKKCPWQAKKEG
jgi:hypothetical protein